MSENDPQLELKKRARRRLVGAAALAILAAIVLPMVMDQAPRQPPAEDIQIRIPAQDAGAFTSRILPLKPGATPTPLPPAVAPENTVVESGKQSSAKPESKAASGTESQTEQKGERKTTSKAERKTVATDDEVGSGATVNKRSEPSTAPIDGRRSVREQTQAMPTATVTDGAQWIVQLGAYRDQTNVHNLTAKLKQQGYNFYTETLPSPDGSMRIRVRAGPFSSKEAAEAARERIRRIGVDGIVAQK
jgi:DedD protein